MLKIMVEMKNVLNKFLRWQSPSILIGQNKSKYRTCIFLSKFQKLLKNGITSATQFAYCHLSPPQPYFNFTPTINTTRTHNLLTMPPKPEKLTTTLPHALHKTHSAISHNYQPHPHLVTRMMTAAQTSMRRG